MTRPALQAQRQRPVQALPQSEQKISFLQSMKAVGILLNSSIAAIVNIRELLPQCDFDQVSLVPVGLGIRDSSLHAMSNANTQSQTGTRGKPFSFSYIKDSTLEGKRILDLIKSIEDAVEKTYLKKCTFGIFLDERDPNNMLETYTFDFQYPYVESEGRHIPMLNLSDGLGRLSLESRAQTTITLGDVKRQIRAMTQAIMVATNHMEPLPPHRWATFKLEYYDERTPEDYEPPMFRGIDLEQNEWFFSTHNSSETPESVRIARNVSTGFHKVTMKITSVTKFLPNGELDHRGLSGVQYQTADSCPRAEADSVDSDIAMEDAKGRTFRWDSNNFAYDDADGEEDPDYVCHAPFGSKNVPMDVGELNARTALQDVHDELPETQVLARSDKLKAESFKPSRSSHGRGAAPRRSTLPSSSVPASQLSAPLASQNGRTPMDVDSLALPKHRAVPSVNDVGGPANKKKKATVDLSDSDMTPDTQDGVEHMRCACGVQAHDMDTIQCDGGCKAWYHCACVGFHSANDPRISEVYVCFECRFRQNVVFPVLQQYDGDSAGKSVRVAYQDLASFRRGIKVFQAFKVDNFKDFHEQIKLEARDATSVWNRMYAEGFIMEQADHSSRSSGKGGKRRNVATDKQWSFVARATETATYREYFDPSPSVELQKMSLHAEVKDRLLAGLFARRPDTGQPATSQHAHSDCQTPVAPTHSTSGMQTRKRKSDPPVPHLGREKKKRMAARAENIDFNG